MATKLYFIGIGNSLSGTFPTGEQSSLTPSWSLTGASNLYTMRTTTGGAQVSLSGSSLANTSLQRAFCAHFASDTLNTAQSVGGGSNTVTINVANRESNLSMNFGSDLRFHVYVWRPSTGAKVGTIGDCLVTTGSVEPGAANSERSNSASTSSTSTVSAIAGDVIICEIWQFHTQAAATSYTGDVWASGTVETATANTVVTDHASFISFSADTLTFGTPSTDIGATLAITLAADTSSSGSVVSVAGSSSITVQADTSSGTSVVGVLASGAVTLQSDSISSVSGAAVLGQSALTVANDSLSADASLSGSTSLSADVTITLAGDSVSAQSVAAVVGSASLVVAGDVAASLAGAGVGASLSITVQADSAQGESSAVSSGDASLQMEDDQASLDSTVLVISSLSLTLESDTATSIGSLKVAAVEANIELDDSAESTTSVDISAASDSIVAADIMSASVSVGGELTPSIERTLFIGAQSRSNVIELQRRTSAPVAQSRVVAIEPQHRQQTLVSQTRTVAPEPQNRNIAE